MKLDREKVEKWLLGALKKHAAFPPFREGFISNGDILWMLENHGHELFEEKRKDSIQDVLDHLCSLESAMLNHPDCPARKVLLGQSNHVGVDMDESLLRRHRNDQRFQDLERKIEEVRLMVLGKIK